MSKPKILLQLDTDPQPSVFDSVVAIDAGVDQLLRHQGVTPEATRDLVHGAIFTRGPEQLHHTAIFIGGSDVARGEAVLEAATKSFLGPLRVSVLLDSGGANTTAAAAVLAAQRQLDLAATTALVLAATGPVGQRVVRLLAGQGARVRIGSRDPRRADQVRRRVEETVDGAKLVAVEIGGESQLREVLEGVGLVISAGPPGVELVPEAVLSTNKSLRAAIDLSAVPPLGIGGVEISDKRTKRGEVVCYGALGIGGTKMKIHRAALERLFTANDLVLDAESIFDLGGELE